MLQQFDIVENRNSAARRHYPFLLILQHDRMGSVKSRVLAPLIEWTPAIADSRMHPTIFVDGRRYVVLIEELAAVPITVLGEQVASAEGQRYQIVGALDLLFTGI